MQNDENTGTDILKKTKQTQNQHTDRTQYCCQLHISQTKYQQWWHSKEIKRKIETPINAVFDIKKSSEH